MHGNAGYNNAFLPRFFARSFFPASRGKQQLSRRRPPHRSTSLPPTTFQSSLTVSLPAPLLSLHRGNARIKTIEETNERERTYIRSLDRSNHLSSDLYHHIPHLFSTSISFDRWLFDIPLLR